MMDYSWKEMMAVFFARDLEDGERVACGANTEITFAAAMLAQKMRAPNLKLQLGGTCYLCNVADQEIPELPRTSVDYRIVRWAEAYFHHPETCLYFGPPGGRRYLNEPNSFQDTNKYFMGDKFFVSGLQVDRHGNVNLIGLGQGHKFKVRGPGSIGICDLVTVKHLYAFLTDHHPSKLVEKTDYISTPGWAAWRKYHHLGGGIKLIVTPKAVFARDPETDLACLSGVFPGVTLEEVKRLTGFPVTLSPRFEPLPPPSREELSILRGEVDRTGVLRR
jgi:glutaconate CoA-transferase subunit B